MSMRDGLKCFLGSTVLVIAFAAHAQAEEEILWHIRAIHPEGQLLNVVAIDQKGASHDVKAIMEPGNHHVIDIKAFVGEHRLPVKVLGNAINDKYAPVKAIGGDGTIFGIKALTPDGQRLDVKGVKRSGNLIHIKAIASDGTFYGVKAISPQGHLYDVKGIKMTKNPVEGSVSGVPVAAHIKALPQPPAIEE